MKGDFSRRTFRADKHYTSVRMQQGRLQLDADWNEQVEIQEWLQRQVTSNVLGEGSTTARLSTGFAPEANAGFGVTVTVKDSTLSFTSGNLYVGGWLCQADKPFSYVDQPYYPEPGYTAVSSDVTSTQRKINGIELRGAVVYLRAWQRLVTGINDPQIRDVALGGVDTAARAQLVWQVCLLPSADKERAPWTRELGQLAAKLDAQEDAGSAARENRLYRVEVHSGGTGAEATFKWSRDNGSIAVGCRPLSKETVELTGSGVFEMGQWIELTDDQDELRGVPGLLGLVKQVDARTLSAGFEIGVRPWLNPRIRRWDSEGPVHAKDGWLALERGLRVRIDPDKIYQTGDYWLIATRALAPDIEWPRDAQGEPIAQSPHGIEYKYAVLAVIGPDGRIADARKIFRGLAAQTAGADELRTLVLDLDQRTGRDSSPKPVVARLGGLEQSIQNIMKDTTQVGGISANITDLTNRIGTIENLTSSPTSPLSNVKLGTRIVTLESQTDGLPPLTTRVGNLEVSTSLLTQSGSSLDGRLRQVETLTGRPDASTLTLVNRVGSLESLILSIRNDTVYTTLSNKVTDLGTRVVNQETLTLGASVGNAALGNRVTNLEPLVARVSTVESLATASGTGLAGLNSRLTVLETTTSQLPIQNLSSRLGTLETLTGRSDGSASPLVTRVGTLETLTSDGGALGKRVGTLESLTGSATSTSLGARVGALETMTGSVQLTSLGSRLGSLENNKLDKAGGAISGNLSVAGTGSISGNVGIGSSPDPGTIKLSVTGDTRLTGALTVTTDISIGTTGIPAKLSVTGTGSFTGNIGIGTDPDSTTKLSVGGDAKVTGSLRVASISPAEAKRFTIDWNAVSIELIGRQPFWGSEANNVWAVGRAGRILRWDGNSWTPQAIISQQDLYAIWGSGPNDVWAVGLAGTILRWNGLSWKSQAYNSLTSYTAIWGSGPNDVWVAGGGGITKWNGSTWTAYSIGSKSILSIWGSGPNDVWAVGLEGAILRWNGSSWSSYPGGSSTSITSIWGSGPNDVWAAGWEKVGSTILRWNGSSWSSYVISDYVAKAIWGSGPSDVWAVGTPCTAGGGSDSSLGSRILRWNGNSWTSYVTNTFSEDLTSVWGSDAKNIWIGQSNGVMGRLKEWWESLKISGNVDMLSPNAGRSFIGDDGSSYVSFGKNPQNNGKFVVRAYSQGSPVGTETSYKNVATIDQNGTFTATTKNFVIPHPEDKQTRELVHSCLEGPELAVFYRGEAQLSDGRAIVALPSYFELLTLQKGRTIHLTPIWEDGDKACSMLVASRIKDGRFGVHAIDRSNPSQRFCWEVKAVRADVDPLEVERLNG